MATRVDVVAAARSLIGTPYHSHARLPGIGTDCIGVPILTTWITGLKPRTFDIQGYSMQPDGTLLPTCDQHLTRIRRDEMQAGDMVVLQYGKQPHHVGMLVPYRHGGLSIVHAENYRYWAVTEMRLWLDGVMQFVRAYRIPGVAA